MILTTIIALVASQVYDTLCEKGKDFLIDKGMDKGWSFLTKNREDFTTELTKVITKSVASYKELHPNHNYGSKIEFYESQTFMEELLKFSFTKELDTNKIQVVIENDNRIMVPAQDEINDFLCVLYDNVNSNEKLKDLFVSENYQQEIFTVSKKFSDLGSRIESQIAELKGLLQNLTSPQLVIEWNKQLDEIEDDYKLLKHKTARSRIIALRRRMEENGQTDNLMKARAISIQADCSKSLFNNLEADEIAKLHLQAYQLTPHSQNYKTMAAMAYLSLGEPSRAIELANEIKFSDEYNLAAWLVLCYANGTTLDYIQKNVPEILRNDKTFQLNIVNKKMAAYQFDDINILIKQGYHFFETKEDEPERISYRNLSYWSIWCTVAIVLYFSAKKEFKTSSIDEDAYDPTRLKKIQSVLKKIIDAIKDTEIENDFAFLSFQYHYICLIGNFNDVDLQGLKESHNNLKQIDLNYTLTFQLIRALATSGKDDDLKSAMEIIDKVPAQDNGLFLLFKINHYLDKNEEFEVTALIKKYYSSIDDINNINVANILQLFDFHYQIDQSEALFEIRNLAAKKKSHKESYQNLLFTKASITEGIIGLPDVKKNIDTLASEIGNEPNYIKNHVAQFYTVSGLLDDAHQFLGTYVDSEILDETTLIFCEVLYRTPSRRLTLQTVLEAFRNKNIYLPKKLIEYDVIMAKTLYDYKRIKEICLYGLQFYPNSNALIYDLIFSLNQLQDKPSLIEHIHLLNRMDFAQNINAGTVLCEVLFTNDFFSEALELIYNLALKTKSTKIREYYVSKILTTADLNLEKADCINIGTQVIYSVDAIVQEVEITAENFETNEVQQLLDKKIGEEFLFSDRNFKQHKIVVNGIIDKYRLLLNKILKETSNPLNGFDMTQFSLDENSEQSSSEQIVQKLIENYGPQEEMRQQQIKIDIEEYYSNELPFMMVTRKVFKGNAIEAYLFLTSNDAKVFRIPPSIFYDDIPVSKENSFILDIPTIVLFYQLKTDYGIIIPDHKYKVSNAMMQLLRNILIEVIDSKGAVGNIHVTPTGAQSTFYSEEYHRDRIGFHENVLKWVETNCTIILVPERLEVIPNLDEETIGDVFFQSVLDNLLLSQRDHYNLIASDMFYFKHLSGRATDILSIEIYLKAVLSSEDFDRIKSILLKKNMVGLTLQEDILNKEFIKRQAEKENRYSVCLENLMISWNGTANLVVAIAHIKWLMLQAIISNKERLMFVEDVFCSMLPGILGNQVARDLITIEISRQFKLLDKSIGDTVFYCLRNAFNYLHSSQQ